MLATILLMALFVVVIYAVGWGIDTFAGKPPRTPESCCPVCGGTGCTIWRVTRACRREAIR